MTSFPFNLYFAAFLTGIVGSAVSFPFWKKWCERLGHVDDPGHRKIHSTSTPLAGGLTVMTGFFLPIALGLAGLLLWKSADFSFSEVLQYGVGRRALQLAAVLAGALGMVLLGWFDDHYELRPFPKFTGQFVLATLVALSGIRVTLFIPSDLAAYILTVLWILTITNAFNFLDNMNGLCTGLGFIASWCCAWAAAIQGQYLVAMLGFLIAGALLGFFPFNFPKAKAFLGDAGSHLVGFLIAVLAILPNFYSPETPNTLAVLSPLLILAVPIYDLCSVVLIRWKKGQPFYIGDTSHISHRLAGRFSRIQAVLLLLLVHALAGAVALLVLHRL
jgi:UDP-GlcNAc:undecaprenyl-phosphate GlcNAc-1-phosphate transferase